MSVLNLPLAQPNDAKAATVRDYLVALLTELWEEDEGFSGKRPFGNSGWQRDLHQPLIDAGLVEENDFRGADRMIADAILELGQRP